MTAKREQVRDLGEFEVIRRLTGRLPLVARQGGLVDIGIGDDAAVWRPPPGRALVVTTDALVEGVHFRLDSTDWRSLGHKMLAVNISDIAAMGAEPRMATIVLGLTGKELIRDLEELYDGAGSIAAAYGLVIAGGDIVRAPNDFTISVTVIGDVEPGHLLLRSGASPGDLVVVSGTLGASAAGLALLGESPRREAATADLLVAAHLRPVPRVSLGRELHAVGVTAAMDLSDGLLGDLRKVLEASAVSGEIDVESIPVLPAVRSLFPETWSDMALRGGEDYELLMTIPPERFDSLRDRAGRVGATVTVVGRIVAADGPPTLALVRNGVREVVDTGSWDHFGSTSKDDRGEPGRHEPDVE